MDSWRYMPGGKNIFLSEDLDNLPVDGIASSQGASMEWETKPSYGVRSYPLSSNSGPVENSSGLMELGFSDKSYSNDPSRLVSSSDYIGIESCKRSSFPAFNSSNPVAPGEGSSSRISNLFMESNRKESMMFDLKLGGFTDSGFTKDGQLFREGASKLSSSSPSPAKRGRSTSLNLQAPLCQVHGCNKDLSAFKDYYKRHKVCEAHTKTAKVIVNGIEQRFCQQCSRFHLLAEFDEGKRSCRKRLADHNERRRKPQLAAGSGSSILESCILRGSSPCLQDKLLPTTDSLGCSKYKSGKITGQINFEASPSSLKAAAEDVPSGIRERMFGMAACNGQDVRHTSRALSLLSDRTQDIPTHLLRSQSSGQLMTKMDMDGRRADCKSKVPANHFRNESGFMDRKDGGHHHHHHLNLGGGTMVDMHQLSSHLQRVEEQRNSEPVRPSDHHVFSSFHPSSEGE